MTTDKNNSQVTVPMWWDGGDRAITAREKARIEERGPSCFSIALVPVTDVVIAQNARAIPAGLDQVYKALDLAADGPFFYVGAQTAAGVGTHFQAQPGSFRLFCGDASFANAHAIVAALNWLRENREALTATCKQPLQVGEVQGDGVQRWEIVLVEGDSENRALLDEVADDDGDWVRYHDHLAALAARQLRAQEQVTAAAVDKAWSRFEAALQAPDGDTPEDRILGQTMDQRDRYHEVADDLAAHLARITGVEIGEHSSVNCPWQNAIDAAESYAPAQGIDPGPVREFLRRRMAQWRSHLPSDPGAPGTVAISGDGEGGYNNDVRMYREGIALMDRVLALIDDQRDATPGVGNG